MSSTTWGDYGANTDGLSAVTWWNPFWANIIRPASIVSIYAGREIVETMGSDESLRERCHLLVLNLARSAPSNFICECHLFNVAFLWTKVPSCISR